MPKVLKRATGPIPWSDKLFRAALVLSVICAAIAFIFPTKGDPGGWAMFPVAFLITFIIMTQGRMIEGFVLGSTIAFIVGTKTGFFWEFIDSYYAVQGMEDIIWMIGMIMGMGAILVLMEVSGVSFAFAKWLGDKAKGEKSALRYTFLLGIIVFLDDYLNCIMVGSSMRPVTDKFKVSREELAYVVDSTAAPVSVLVPVSSWVAFGAICVADAGIVDDTMGFMIKTIPFNFYAWTTLILVFLLLNRFVPHYGPMKAAVKRARDTGQLAPPNSSELTEGAVEKEGIWKFNFLVVMVILIIATLYFDIDLMIGTFVTIIAMFVLFLLQRIMTIKEFFDTCIKGFQSMVPVSVLLVFIFIFLDSVERLGFQQYVIDAAEPYLADIPWMMPVICFVIFSVMELAIGSKWGLYALAFPIVLPLAVAVGANEVLSIAAVFSAGAVGAHMCMYSDNMVLSGTASGCNIFRHAITQLPYCLTTWFISVILFAISGYMFQGSVL